MHSRAIPLVLGLLCTALDGEVRAGLVGCGSQKLIASDAAEYESFGLPIATDGTVALIGAPNASTASEDSGAAYVFDVGCLPADLNGDGVVNGADLGILLAFWGSCTGLCLGDLNDDAVVDGADLGLLLSEWQS